MTMPVLCSISSAQMPSSSGWQLVPSAYSWQARRKEKRQHTPHDPQQRLECSSLYC